VKNSNLFSEVPFTAKIISSVICIFDFGHTKAGALFADHAENVIKRLAQEGYVVTLNPIIYRDTYGMWNCLKVSPRGLIDGYLNFDNVTNMVDAMDMAKEFHGYAVV
jgi:hypothetical protein